MFLGLVVGLTGFIFAVRDFNAYIHNNAQYRTRVVFKGLQKLNKQQLISKLSTFRSRGQRPSLVSLSVSEVQSELQQKIPRLKMVDVRKSYPNKLIIRVKERRPVSLIARVSEKTKENSNRIYLPVDRDGVVFPPTPKEVEKLPDRLPVVKGLEGIELDSKSYHRKWDQIGKVIDAFQGQFSLSELDWIKRRTGGYIEIQINRPKTLKIRLGMGSFTRKLTQLKRMKQTQQFLEIERYVDLSNLENVRVM